MPTLTRYSVVFVFAALFTSLTHAQSSFKSTLELKDECALAERVINGVEKLSDPSKALICGAYITGYVEAVLYMQHTQGAKPIACSATTMSLRQFAAVYVKWADAHPESWNTPAATTLPVVVSQAYPCKQ